MLKTNIICQFLEPLINDLNHLLDVFTTFYMYMYLVKKLLFLYVNMNLWPFFQCAKKLFVFSAHT